MSRRKQRQTRRNFTRHRWSFIQKQHLTEKKIVKKAVERLEDLQKRGHIIGGGVDINVKTKRIKRDCWGRFYSFGIDISRYTDGNKRIARRVGKKLRNKPKRDKFKNYQRKRMKRKASGKNEVRRNMYHA